MYYLEATHTTIKYAYWFCINAHTGQKRKISGLPYHVHPIAVAGLLQHYYPQDVNLICAGLLHDVVEDCGIDYSLLNQEFNKRISKLVREVTQPQVEGNRKIRWAAYLAHYKNASNRGKILKIADRVCNLTDWVNDFYAVDKSEHSFLKKVYIPESKELANTVVCENDQLNKRLLLLINSLEELV